MDPHLFGQDVRPRPALAGDSRGCVVRPYPPMGLALVWLSPVVLFDARWALQSRILIISAFCPCFSR